MSSDNEYAWLTALTQYAYISLEELYTVAKSLPAEPVDWDWIASEAIRHRVGATVAAALAGLNLLNHVSEPVQAKLASRIHNQSRWQIFLDELRTIVEACQAADLRIQVLRGPVVSHFYRAPHWRYFQDFDLLIAPDLVQRFDQLMQDLGYVQGNIDESRQFILPMSDIDIQRQSREKRLHAYLKRAHRPFDFFIVEPHTSLFTKEQPYHIPIDVLLAPQATISPLTTVTNLPTLSLEYYLLELCVHIYDHAITLPSMRSGSDTLLYRWLDLAVLIARFDAMIDWEELAVIARRYNLILAVAYGLYPVAQLYRCAIPKLESFLPQNFDTRSREVWYFDAAGTYRCVTTIEADLITRLFERHWYAELAAWEEHAQLDETQVLHPHHRR